MRTITTTTVVYAFDELPTDKARETAVESVQTLLSNWDSHDLNDIRDTITYELGSQLHAPGHEDHGTADYPGIDGVTLDGWDLDRGRSLAVSGVLTRNNAPALPWVEGIDTVTLSPHARNDFTRVLVVDAEPDRTRPALVSHPDPHVQGSPSLDDTTAPDHAECVVNMITAVHTALTAAWQAGYDEGEYKTSEEYAKEWIEGNAPEFTEDGTRYVGP